MEDENEVYFEYLDDLRESAVTNMGTRIGNH